MPGWPSPATTAPTATASARQDRAQDGARQQRAQAVVGSVLVGVERSVTGRHLLGERVRLAGVLAGGLRFRQRLGRVRIQQRLGCGQVTFRFGQSVACLASDVLLAPIGGNEVTRAADARVGSRDGRLRAQIGALHGSLPLAHVGKDLVGQRVGVRRTLEGGQHVRPVARALLLGFSQRCLGVGQGLRLCRRLFLRRRLRGGDIGRRVLQFGLQLGRRLVE